MIEIIKSYLESNMLQFIVILWVVGSLIVGFIEIFLKK
jgi:hypothetical protein